MAAGALIVAWMNLGTAAIAALKVGSKAPDFSTQATLAGQPFQFVAAVVNVAEEKTR